MNQLVLVGRIVNDVEVIGNDRKKYIVTLAVQRNFKNMDGIFETDFIPCILWNTVGESTLEYCGKGDIIGIKGRLQTRTIENEDGTKSREMEVIAEKVTFLSARKNFDLKIFTKNDEMEND